ncbi:hypothetical protein PAPYR_8189 [Paratrimastix pyriformis]|uniref:TRAF-type domain-containing protein n=1 Tax=Paratrimastix pyriformis TaxID=342808 RepID=A0ABQ8UGK9_9EUKA|nr:hypothetical protein PAPYR_8189 [Paratrimastix pyriformis]
MSCVVAGRTRSPRINFTLCTFEKTTRTLLIALLPEKKLSSRLIPAVACLTGVHLHAALVRSSNTSFAETVPQKGPGDALPVMHISKILSAYHAGMSYAAHVPLPSAENALPATKQSPTSLVTLCPRFVHRQVEMVQCRCPNKELGCDTVMGVLLVERHLARECEWRDEDCERCRGKVPHALMGQHLVTTCAAKPIPCDYAEVGCETRCPQGDMPAHTHAEVVPHAELLRRQLARLAHDLADTQRSLAQQLDLTRGLADQSNADLTQRTQDLAAQIGQLKADTARTQQELAETRGSLAQTRTQILGEVQGDLVGVRQTQTRDGEQLARVQGELAEVQGELVKVRAELTKVKQGQQEAGVARQELTLVQGELAKVRAELKQAGVARQELALARGEVAEMRTQFMQFFMVPSAPEGFEAVWDAPRVTVILTWRPVPPIVAAAPLPITYRVKATFRVRRLPHEGVPRTISVLLTGRTCRREWLLPGCAEVHFELVAIRGQLESFPATLTFAPPPGIELTYDHDMDEQGLFYYLGTQGRTQPWQNPAQAGWVTVTTSYRHPSDPSGHDDGSPVLQHGQKAGWGLGRQYSSGPPTWRVDLGPGRLFVPHQYTIRNSSTQYDLMQSWRLDGSLDGLEWRTLDEQTHGLPNVAVGATNTFGLDSVRTFAARHLRLVYTEKHVYIEKTGEEMGRYMSLGGLEMYGTLRLLQPTPP